MTTAEDNNQTEAEQLSAKKTFFYALGAISENIMANLVFILAMPIYQLALGVSPWLLGLALGVPRFWDALIDPLVASISDNARTRFGRRKPFILTGAILTAVLCVLLWTPPLSLSEKGLFIYFLTISMLYSTSFAIFVIPYSALGVELTNDPKERVRLMTYRSFLMGLGGILFLSWVYKLCIFVGNWMSDGTESVEPEVLGVRVIGTLCALMMVFFVIFPVFFTREKYAHANKEKIPIFRSMLCTFKNKPFAFLCLTHVTMTMGVFLIAPLGMYINLAYILQMNKDRFATMAGIYSMLFGFLMMAPAPLISFLGTRYSRKKVVLAGLSMILSSYMISWFTYTPRYPYLQLVHALLTAPGFCCMGLMAYVFIADICDFDELETGFRREGMYHAIFAWCTKASYAGATALTGFIVTWTGFQTTALAQSAQTITRLRVAFMTIPIIFLIASIYFMSRYPLGKKQMQQVQLQLQEARKTRSAETTA